MIVRARDLQDARRRGFWRGVGTGLAACIVAAGMGVVFGLFLR
jgi:hypothetical protein